MLIVSCPAPSLSTRQVLDVAASLIKVADAELAAQVALSGTAGPRLIAKATDHSAAPAGKADCAHHRVAAGLALEEAEGLLHSLQHLGEGPAAAGSEVASRWRALQQAVSQLRK